MAKRRSGRGGKDRDREEGGSGVIGGDSTSILIAVKVKEKGGVTWTVRSVHSSFVLLGPP